jgi:ribosome recycling factor
LFELKEYEARMARTLEVLATDMGKIRGGRAHAGMLDHVKIKCYGTEMPLSQTATVTAQDARVLLISSWDKQNLQPIEKSLLESDLGVGIAIEGDKIRVTVPQLSEERRGELVKVVRKEVEVAKVAIRNIRRDGNTGIKHLLKEGEIGKDDAHRLETGLQKVTDLSIEKTDAMSQEKESDLMKI